VIGPGLTTPSCASAYTVDVSLTAGTDTKTVFVPSVLELVSSSTGPTIGSHALPPIGPPS
jgi:hypothetical protein